MSRIDFFFLGFPRLQIDDQPVAVTLRSAWALFALLAENSAVLSREAAATLLWPEADSVTSAARLRRLLHRIRTITGVDLIDADRVALRWNEEHAIEIDSRLFIEACKNEDLGKAVELYRGDFLGGMSLSPSAELDEWVFFRREALRSRYIRALELLIEKFTGSFDPHSALIYGRRLVEVEPLRESAHRQVIAAHLAIGDRAAAQRQFDACAGLLQKELGVVPERTTVELLNSGQREEQSEASEIAFTEVDGLHLAYRTIGKGDLDIVLVPGFVTHVERVWDDPRCRGCLQAISCIGRVVLFDRRGVGLSDRVGDPPTERATARDIRAVITVVKSRKVILFGASEGGPSCVRMARDFPGRISGMLLWGALAKGCAEPDYPYALSRDQYALWVRRLLANWGGPAELATFAPTLVGDKQAENWWAGLLRGAASPGTVKAVIESLRDSDVRALLPDVSVPTIVLHRLGDRAVRVEAGRYLASNIPGADFVELEGDDHWFWVGDQKPLLSAVKRLANLVNGAAHHRIQP